MFAKNIMVTYLLERLSAYVQQSYLWKNPSISW